MQAGLDHLARLTDALCEALAHDDVEAFGFLAAQRAGALEALGAALAGAAPALRAEAVAEAQRQFARTDAAAEAAGARLAQQLAHAEQRAGAVRRYAAPAAPPSRLRADLRG